MPYVSLGKQSLYYARQSTAASPQVVLIHGVAGSHLDWPPNLRRLTAASVYAIDLPGHGRSPGPACSTIDSYADVVSAFITELDLFEVVLIGHSMGGAIALSIALRKPDFIKGLALISSGARLRVMDELLDGTLSDFEATVESVTKSLWSEEAPQELKTLGKGKFIANKPEIVYADFAACNGFDIMERLDLIQVPTLVICGSEDKMTPVKYSRYLVNQMPNAKLKEVEGAGHMLPLERPEIVALYTNQFLKEITQI